MFIHRAGQLDMSTALGLTAYLDKEREYVPWSSALSHLGFIGSMLSMRPSYGFYRVSSLTPVNLEPNGPVFTKATPNKRRKVEAPVETKGIKFLILYHVYCFQDKKIKRRNNRKSNRDYTLGDRKFFFLRGGKQETALVRLLAEKKKQQQPLASWVL